MARRVQRLSELPEVKDTGILGFMEMRFERGEGKQGQVVKLHEILSIPLPQRPTHDAILCPGSKLYNKKGLGSANLAP